MGQHGTFYSSLPDFQIVLYSICPIIVQCLCMHTFCHNHLTVSCKHDTSVSIPPNKTDLCSTPRTLTSITVPETPFQCTLLTANPFPNIRRGKASSFCCFVFVETGSQFYRPGWPQADYQGSDQALTQQSFLTLGQSSVWIVTCSPQSPAC